ncbi:hypothetical protein Pan161_57660 [Gimesia algae]|uniref:Uncharacterized protein n=1 Tax=Gimesia algae TaxID=2527971 RepID=A0A517VM39_9PLAN|nr:hypothetical protein Pan161_57660 [Gimesia algae]
MGKTSPLSQNPSTPLLHIETGSFKQRLRSAYTGATLLRGLNLTCELDAGLYKSEHSPIYTKKIVHQDNLI